MSEPKVLPTDSDLKSDGLLFNWQEERIWVPLGDHQSVPSEPIDRVVICSSESHNWNQILHEIKPKQVLIGQQMSYTNMKKISSICNDLGIEFRKVRDSGPLTL